MHKAITLKSFKILHRFHAIPNRLPPPTCLNPSHFKASFTTVLCCIWFADKPVYNNYHKIHPKLERKFVSVASHLKYIFWHLKKIATCKNKWNSWKMHLHVNNLVFYGFSVFRMTTVGFFSHKSIWLYVLLKTFPQYNFLYIGLPCAEIKTGKHSLKYTLGALSKPYIRPMPSLLV